MNVITHVKSVADSLGVPPWTVVVGAALSAVAAVLAVGLTLRLVGKAVARAIDKAREDDDNEARARVIAMIDDRWRTIVGICGMSVSMYGLWGFADDTAGLPVVLRIFFIAIFDGAEVGLMLGLARALAAQKQPRWTEGMRRSRRMAWGLVAISAAANWAHAPEGGGWWAKVALAGVPVVSIKLLEHGLDLRIAELVQAEEEEGVRPGPLRLFVLLWRKTWIALFARLGLDAASTTNETSRRLLAQRASRAVIELSRAQTRAAKTFKFGWTKALAERKVEALTTDAAFALDRADAPVDLDQALAVVRRTMGHMQAGQLGRLDYDDIEGVVSTVVSLPALQELVQRRLDQQRVEVQDEMRAREREAEQARDDALAALTAEQEERERITAEREADRERFERLAEDLREQITAAREAREAAKRDAAEQIRVLRGDAERSAKREVEDRKAEREATEQRAERDAKRWSEAVEQVRAEAKQQTEDQAERFEREAAERLAAERKSFAEQLERLRTEAERAKAEAVEQAKGEATERLAAERAEAEQALAAERAKAERLRTQLEAKPERQEPAEQAKQEQRPRAERVSGAGGKELPSVGKGSLKERFIARVHELCEQADPRLLGEQVTPRTRTAVAYQLQAELKLGSQGTARTYMQDAMELWQAKVKVPGPKEAEKPQKAQDKKPAGKLVDTFGRPIADLDKLDTGKSLLGV